MVIQRWQTVLLLVSVVFVCLFCASPFAVDTMSADAAMKVYASDFPWFLALNIVAGAVLLVSIFLYSNLKRQMAVTLVGIVLLVCSLIACGVVLFCLVPGGEIVWTGGALLLFAALICAAWARSLMKKDYNLLRSYDRMR